MFIMVVLFCYFSGRKSSGCVSIKEELRKNIIRLEKTNLS